MNILKAFSNFLNYSEQAEEPDEFISIMEEFVATIGAANFLYTNTTSSNVDLVFGSSLRHELRDSPTCPVLISNHSDECVLLNSFETSAMFAETLIYFGEPLIPGYACNVRIASAARRRAQLTLFGLESPDAFNTLCSTQILPLLGMECDRRLRQLSTFRPELFNVLSSQERRCLAWASKGKNMEDIGQIVGITRRTVEFHITNARHKLGACNITHAACEAMRAGIL